MSDGSNLFLKGATPGVPQLTVAQQERLMPKLLAFLARRTMRYTMEDSSSVPVETAQALMQSILFTLGFAGVEPEALLNCPMEQAFDLGLRAIEDELEFCRDLYDRVRQTAPPLNSLSYWDTIAGIGSFFQRYDYRFFAQLIPCDIDYQLVCAVSEQCRGVEYIRTYLERLHMENQILAQFDAALVKSLLVQFCPEYEALLVNLCEPVLANAIGLGLVEAEIGALTVTEDQRRVITELLDEKGDDAAKDLLVQGAQYMCTKLGLFDPACIEYAADFAATLWPRIQVAAQAGTLQNVFLEIPSA